MKEDRQVNENVIKFRKRKPEKKPRPGLRKLLTILAIVAAFLAMWVYFALTGRPA